MDLKRENGVKIFLLYQIPKFPNVMKTTLVWIQRAQWNLSTCNIKKIAQYILIKFLKTSDKKKILKNSQKEKQYVLRNKDGSNRRFTYNLINMRRQHFAIRHKVSRLVMSCTKEMKRMQLTFSWNKWLIHEKTIIQQIFSGCDLLGWALF